MSPKGVLWTATRNRLRLSDGHAGDRARVLERDRIALLRHDAARLDEAVGKAQIADLRRAPQQQVLHDTSEAGEQHSRRRHALQQVVDGRDAAVGVAGRAVEAEQRCRAAAVDRKPGAGDRAGAERIAIRRGVRGLQPHGIAFELLDDGEQVVRDGRRLRRLRVRVRRENRLARARSARSSRARRRPPPLSTTPQDHLPLPHPVHRHVDVVARARGVQPAGDLRAARLGDQPLDERRTGPRRCRRSVQPDLVERHPIAAPSRIARASARVTMPCSASMTRWA